MRYKKIIGFDFGLKRIGVAIGYPGMHSAHPLTTLQAKDGAPDWNQMDQLIAQWKPEALVVGMPYRMDEGMQKIGYAAKKFSELLEARCGLKIFFQDERLTTVSARQDIFEAGGYKQLKKTQIDSVAAQKILESWMNAHEDHQH